MLELIVNIVKVYDVINLLNSNLKTHFVWYLYRKIKSDIENWSIDKEHIYGKIMQKIWTKN